MVHLFNKRTITNAPVFIGAQDDSGVEVHDFVLPRMYGGVDLSRGIAYILYAIAGDEAYVTPEMIVTDETLTLRWKVMSLETAAMGIGQLQIKISNAEREIWHSEIFEGEILRSLKVPTPIPQMTPFMQAFGATDSGNDSGGDSDFIYIGEPGSGNMGMAPMLANPATEPHFTVTERTINVPGVLQQIAVQLDARSETVYIDIPRFFDDHDLAQYAVYLNTISSGGSDIVPFLNPQVTDSLITCEWVLKPPQTSYSGALQMQLFIIGETPGGEDFRWATAQSSVNIIPFGQAQPVVPTTPTIMDEFLREISDIAQQVHEDAEIAAASSGSLRILGYFNTYAQLTAAVPNPNIGDTYAVGTAAPYDIYTWNAIGQQWRNNGPIQGVKGDNGVTFTPSVNASGIISWTNDGSKPNPAPVNITGPTGAAGPNQVSTDTATPITGILKGNGAKVAPAVADTDYAAVTAGRVTVGLIESDYVDVTANTTLALTHRGKTLRVNNAAARTITIPNNTSVAFPVGSEITVKRQGAGEVTIAAAAGVTIQSADDMRSLRAQYSGCFLKKDATNVWWISGDLA